MDHLPKPIDGQRPTIPWLAERQEVYTPQDFYQIPEDYGCNIDKILENGYSDNARLQNKGELEGFLQSWLWFSLLALVLNRNIYPVDFEVVNNKALHCKSLKMLLREWSEKETRAKDEDSERQRQRYVKASHALAQARRFVSKHLMCERMDREDEDIKHLPNPVLVLSLAILGETLQRTRPEMSGSLEEMTEFWRQPDTEETSWGFSRYSRDKLLDKHKCRHVVHMIESTFASVSAVYYVCEAKLGVQRSGHEHCTAHACKAQPADLPVLHMHPCSGDCALVAVPGGDRRLSEIIKQGRTPLLTWTNNELVVEGYNLVKDDVAFGAVSHTWGDSIIAERAASTRYGGRKTYTCQLDRLQHDFNTKLRPEHDFETKDIPFWVDWLCNPTEAQVVPIALRRSIDVYREAGAVIVWDRDLLEKPGQKSIETNARISLSNWARRLWTFPEAVLAERLYVAFERGLIDILELQKARDDARDNSNSESHHIWEVGHPFSSPVWELRKCLPDRKAKQSLRSAILVPTTTVLPEHGRPFNFGSVTASTDETIVLAQVLGVDMNRLAAIVNSDENKSKQNLAEKLMVALLEELDKTPGLGIPSGIIFLPGPYIRNVPGAKGFGWAPQTWLSHQANSDPLFRPLRQTAEILRRGLKVQFPGLVLHGFPTYPDKVFWVAVHQVIHKWFKVRLQISETEDQAVDAADYWKGRLHPGQEISIIMSTNNPRDRWETGVLVQSKEGGLLSRGSVRWVTRVCRVHVRLETSNVVIARETNKFRKSGEYTILGERLQKDTQWCVDGGSSTGTSKL
ncbi:hypothetical protein LTS10_003507 [Elasticomyces elasticus]|nr:hypothetical protein LTS10_003507 [Elasticomyces elasticus]